MNKAIHGAFRRDLNRFINALEDFPSGDRVRAAQLGTAWANFNAQLTRHHTGEHEIAWPALREIGVDMDLLEQMDAEHEELAAALESAGRRGAPRPPGLDARPRSPVVRRPQV